MRVAVLALTLLFAPSAIAQESESIAAWETGAPDLSNRDCVTLDAARFVVVPMERREAAVYALRSRQIVPLEEANIGFLPSAAPGLRPYLVRAVSSFQSTTFVVRNCGDLLFVMNGALGHQTPPASAMPIVVMLDEAPAHLAVFRDVTH